MSASIPDDLRDQLKKQLGFLQRSCDGYDAGHIEESIRAATAIRVLVHDTHQSTSLLKMMDRKSIKVISSIGWMPDGPWRDYLKSLAQRNKNFHGLAIPKQGKDGRFKMQPSLGQREHWVLVSVDEWWNHVIWMHHQDAQMLSRKDLVLAAANKDGGAHVDLEVPQNYDAIKKRTDGGFYPAVFDYTVDGNDPSKDWESTPVLHEDSHLAAIRQMGYELLNSSELTSLCDYDQTTVRQKNYIWPF